MSYYRLIFKNRDGTVARRELHVLFMHNVLFMLFEPI